MDLSSTYIQQLRTDKGLPLAHEALTFFRQGNYREYTLECLTIIGRANRRKGEYELARKALEEELELARQGSDQPHIAFTEAEIGSVLLEQEQYPQALQQYDQSYAINKGLGRLQGQAYNQHNRGKVLSRLGRFADARQALQEAAAIATAKGYKQLLPDIQLSNAQILLAERRLGEARAQAEQAFRAAGTDYKDVAVEARSTMGLARMLAGSAREGKALCEEALKLAQDMGDAGLVSRTMLALAETTLEMGDAQTALQVAGQVQERFAHAGQLESEWRACLIMARSNERIGNITLGEQQRGRAKEILARLEQSWGTDAYKQYLARPDIAFYYGQLGR
jgi:tetratricopeptide (TPR) repeat protein